MYRCSGRGPCHAYLGPLVRLDAAVLRKVRLVVDGFMRTDRMVGPALAVVWSAAHEPSALEQRRWARAEEAATRARRRLARAAELLAIGHLDAAGYELVRDAAQADLDTAATALRLLAEARPPRPLPLIGLIRERARAWAAALDGDDVRAQREVLGDLVARVEAVHTGWRAYDVQITWTALGQGLISLPLRARRQARVARV